MTSLITALILPLIFTQNEAARILAVFPVPSISHQYVFRPLMQALVRKGHNVTVITTDPAFVHGEAPVNLTEIDVHDISYQKWEDIYKLTSSGNSDVLVQIRAAYYIINEIVELQLEVDNVKQLIKEENFDLLFLEACARPALIFSHVLRIPVIQISSLGPLNFNVETIGASGHPLLYPNPLSLRLYNMTKWEKLVQLWKFYKLENIFNEVEEAENEMVKRMFGPSAPTIKELKNNVHMMFLNIHPLWDGNRSVPPSIIYMGGIHQKPVKEIPKDLKTFLDTSENGVIYMSFGTNVKPSLLPPEKIQIFVKVFSQLPYNVLWKWDKEELPGCPGNIRISKWLPQSDLLRHPKIKVFITQGGLQSTDEAITAGVPLIGFPMLGDQWYNTEKYVHHQIGMKLDINMLTEEEFRNAIKTVIEDKSYRQNVIKLRSLISDQPQSSLERAVWWTEHVLRHGGAKHLRSPAANITWTQYLELELVLYLFAILFSLFSVLVAIVFYLSRIFLTNHKLKNN